MSVTDLPPNADKDAALVEQKARIKPDYSISSTASDPTLAATEEGRTLEYTDTGDRFRWTGAQWMQTHRAGAALIDVENHPSDFPDALSLSQSQIFTGLLNELIIEQKLTNLYLSIMVGEDLRLDNEQEAL